MPITNNSHIPGRKAFKCTVNSAARLLQQTELNNLFTTDSHLSFMINTTKANEVILAKGSPVNAAIGSWAILNEDKYIKIVLSDSATPNFIAFKTTIQVLNSRKRNLFSFNYDVATKTIEFFVNSIPTPMPLVTTAPYISKAQFTAIRQTTDDVRLGRGQGKPFGAFEIFYDVCLKEKLNRDQINDYYQTVYDTRILPSIGKILFHSDRAGSSELIQMNEDGTSLVTLDGMGVYRAYGATSYSSNGQSLASSRLYPNNPATNQVMYKIGNGNIITIPVSVISYPTFVSFKESTNTLFVTHYSGGPGVTNGSHISSYNYQTQILTTNIFLEAITNLQHGPVSYDPVNNQGAYVKFEPGVRPCEIWVRSLTTNTEYKLFSLPYLSGDVPAIYDLRWNKQGTKVGFNAHFEVGNSDYRAAIINADSTDLIFLGYGDTDFCAFSPDGSQVLLSRSTTTDTYANKYQLIIRNLGDGRETNITNHNSNNLYADWKA